MDVLFACTSRDEAPVFEVPALPDNRFEDRKSGALAVVRDSTTRGGGRHSSRL
jgi:hypothetical protein